MGQAAGSTHAARALTHSPPAPTPPPPPSANATTAVGMANSKRRLVPPDGGWGWMVVFGVAVCNCTTQSLLSVYGLLFADTLQDMGVETTGAAIISNCMVAITNFSGLGIGLVMKRYSYRQVAMAGGCMVAIGMFFTSMATSMWHLLITYSVLVGLGLGLLNPSTFVAVNAFFSKARGRAVGISLAGTGLGQMLMPHAVRFLLDQYSFQGCVLVLSAIALHSIPGAALFHPLRWHAKPAPPQPSELQLLKGSKPPSIVRYGSLREKKASGVKEHAQNVDECVPLTGNGRESLSLSDQTISRNSISSRCGNPLTSSLPQPSPLRDVAVVGENLPAVIKMREDDHDMVATGDVELSKEAPTKQSTDAKESCLHRFIRVLDFDLLADPFMLSLLTGLAAVYTAGVNFNMLFPFFLKNQLKLENANVALCMSNMAGFDISSRLLLPAVTDRLHVPARITFLVGSLLLAASRSLLALQTTLPGLLATTAVCGFVRGGTIVNLNLAISENCSPERLPGALGINMVIKGFSILVLGLFIGWLRDASGSYTLCIHLLSFCIVVPMLIWITEIWLRRRRRRRRDSIHSTLHEHVPSPVAPESSPPPYEPPATRTLETPVATNHNQR